MKNEYLKLYLNYLKYEKKLSNNTIISYETELKEFEDFFNNTNLLVAYKARLIHLLVNIDYSLSARIGEIRALQYSKII